jgi:isohexenylglutaconyl-CoA hydratase
LLLDREEFWLTVWFNRPDARNALSGEMAGELLEIARALRDDRSIRGVTFRGKGEVFCAGGDLKAFRTMTGGEAGVVDVAAFSRAGGEVFDAINTLPQVTVMLVHGAAMAGGLGLACAGDVVAVTADCKFALTETLLGIPPAQIAPLVVQRIGQAAARRIMLTAARFDGREAQRLGLADHVVDGPEGFAAVESQIRDAVRLCAPDANATTKEIVLAAPHLQGDAMLDFASERFAACLMGDEGREGVAAFLEKRKPRWAE